MTLHLARAGFDLDLRHGEAREQALVHTLLEARVEAKSDSKCRHTGNLFIEYRHRGQPSGLAATTADRWAFEFDDDCWLIVPTGRVREAARRALAEDRRALGGDFNQSEGALVPIRWFVARTHTDHINIEGAAAA
ncbi:MAG TPA: hypothetical protein VGM33_12710 [Baekduia sp.]|jgi:hypothetical protein